jgi:hypothetical protein
VYISTIDSGGFMVWQAEKKQTTNKKSGIFLVLMITPFYAFALSIASLK